MNAQTALAQATGWIKAILALAFLIAIAAGLANAAFGIDIPIVRNTSGLELAYLAGAYWLVR